MVEERRFTDVRASHDGDERRWLLFAQRLFLLRGLISLPGPRVDLASKMSCEVHAVIIETPCLPHLIPFHRLKDSRSINSLRREDCSRKRIPPTSFGADNCRWPKPSKKLSKKSAT